MRGKKSSRVIMISAAIMVVVGMTMFFIYFSIDAAKNMDVSIYDYTVVSKDNQQTKYDTIIQFVNTSFVPLSAGDTIYNINIDGENLGTGTIKPFLIGPYSTILVKSEFTANNDILNRQDGEIPHERTHLTGTSNYDLYLTAFNVSFDHNPTKDQVQRFISYLLA
tara:strand:+ start:5069 stop:5563 length:495 start_codon:yes stop_codon:yes gene_type:complete